jgi:formate--tetrahydrofolate ligase
LDSDLAISKAARLQRIEAIAEAAGIGSDALIPYGRFMAKVEFDFIRSVQHRPDGALVLVTGISPTPAGEGKTTTTIGLGDALNAIGVKTVVALREPSLGPCFGVKGGATGGGYAQVVPMQEINLHFTGDFHAITAASNLLAAMMDNHVYWGNEQGIDPRRVLWRRSLDMNDRALRQIVNGLGGVANGAPREDGFDITVASEVMAVLCLSRDLADLQQRLGRMIIAQRRDLSFVTAADIKADGAMAALLRDALMPNLVQTIAGTPALVHGGPFANIAHGCNSLQATRLGLKLADVVVTEAGFGADLGGEKFLDIKCRLGGLTPSCAVIVATVRALKMHGGVAKSALGTPDVAAVSRGVANLARHVENMGKFGLPVLVALNRFTSDTEAEIAAIRDAMAELGTSVFLCTHWSDGASGATALAEAVRATIQEGTARFRTLYPDEMGLADKLRTVAREIYRADDIALSPATLKKLASYEAAGFGNVPVCIAKTQYSFTSDPTRLGAPTGHVLPVRDVRLSAGAGFVVAIAGEIMTMPGLPRVPAAEQIRLDETGEIEGLF